MAHMLNKFVSTDGQWDNYYARCCAYDGCRIDMRYTNQNKHQVLNDRRYCSKTCLDKQYQALGIDGAIHLVHQTFGPEHPVTKQIKKMRRELGIYRKQLDLDDRRYIGNIRKAESETYKDKMSGNFKSFVPMHGQVR